MRIIGIITARGGSKGIPRKNIASVAGRPLLAYTAEAALAARRLTRVILSTDDEEIAYVGRGLGVDVPFLRPPDLALDSTPTLPVLQHALRVLADEGEEYDAVCLLQPTNPLRSAAHIDGCIELFERTNADCVISVLPVPHEYNPHWVYFQGGDGSLHLSTGGLQPIPRRQDLPAAYHRDGSVYVTRAYVITKENSLYGRVVAGYVMDAAETVNIDTTADLDHAEAILLERRHQAASATAIGKGQSAG